MRSCSGASQPSAGCKTLLILSLSVLIAGPRMLQPDAWGALKR